MNMVHMTYIFVILIGYVNAFPGVSGQKSTAVKEVTNLHDCRVKLHGMEATANANERSWRDTEKKLLQMEKYLEVCQLDKNECDTKLTSFMHEKGFCYR